jgi:hypothetical protein
VAQNEQINAVQDTAVFVDAAHGVLANDPGATLVLPLVQLLRTTAGGQIYFDTDGSYTYISAPGFSGTDTVQYTTDNAGTGTLTLNVEATALVPFVSVGDQLGARHQITHGFGQVGNGVATTAYTQVALAGGGHVVAIDYLDQAFGTVVDIRTYDADNNLLSVFDPGVIAGMRIVPLSNGDYAVAYGVRTPVDPNDPYGGYTQATSVQVFDATGHSVTGPTPYDVPGSLDALSGLATLPNGGFVLLQATADDGTGNARLFAQSFSAAGVPDGPEYAIGSSDQVRSPAILPNGQIVTNRVANGNELYLQRYDLHGNPIGAEIHPLNGPENLNSAVHVAQLAGGGFAVTWASTSSVPDPDPDEPDHDFVQLYTQVVDANGNLVGTSNERDFGFTTLFGAPNENITPLANGSFVVWGRGTIDNGQAVDIVQVYDASGNSVGDPIEFVSLTSFGVTRALVYALPVGGFAIGPQATDPASHNLLIYDNNGTFIGDVRMHDPADGTGPSSFVLLNRPNGDTLIVAQSFSFVDFSDPDVLGNNDITVQTIRFDTTVPAIQTGEAIKDAAAIVPVKIYIPDPDGSEIVQSIDVSGVPDGWTLDYHGATATLNGGVWTITGPHIAHGGDIDLHLVAPSGTTGSATLSVVAHTIDTDNGSQNQSLPASFDVSLSPAPLYQYAGSLDSGPHSGGYQIAGLGDFNGDGISDVLWRDPATGQVDEWRMKDGHWDGSIDLGSHGAGWAVAAVGDFNGDGTSDVLWHEAATGKLDAWIMNNGQWSKSVDLGSHGTDWQVLAAGDFNGDHVSDILFRNTTTGQLDEWQMAGGNWSKSISLGSYSTAWTFAAAGDLDHDGVSDILWRNPTTGQIDEWRMVDGNWGGSTGLGSFDPSYQLVAIADFNGNGSGDVLFRDQTTGKVEGWLMSNGQWAGSVSLGAFDPAWQFAGAGDFNHAGGADVLWHNPTTGQTGLWLLDAVT